ncbi:glycosyltransferase family 2 protein [Gordonia sputi]|uniref:glycosyltransferase family 2 protein n=1 Tax=Gordonia sputi TaxID=36823 RepID=UPI0028AC3F14|nr:glycosyltransferase family 2 protein [Gordonia sputi]
MLWGIDANSEVGTVGPARLFVVRIIAVLVVSFGCAYIFWRWSDTIAWSAWWIAIPLVIAETYSLSESILFAFMMWNARERPVPPAARPGLTVDVFITTYNEPLELVVRTAIGAREVRYPHNTWILDDGDREEFRAAAAALGVGYLTRGEEWNGRQRHAKAGNINNALFLTDAEFVAILDADQVPKPEFLDAVLGYFDDDAVAFVQTPQYFWNVPESDPLGSQAELFYGPIQQGKDGWGAAFFCGSNAVLRREALMALGLRTYSRGADPQVRKAIRDEWARLEGLINEVGHGSGLRIPLEDALDVVRRARRSLRRGAPVGEVAFELRAGIHDILDSHPWLPEEVVDEPHKTMDSVEVSRIDQALAIQPINTATVTEDMATAMHLHAMGWESVYHHEVLVEGLAPDDLATMLGQRQRWATGSMQVFFADNPLFQSGLTLAQRLMYLATMTSYLNGFAAVVYIAAPIIYFTLGVFPMNAYPLDFFARFIPFFVCCQLLFQVAGYRSGGLWRGQQMSFALFPIWISATLSAAAAVFFRRHISFSVTSKEQVDARIDYRPIIPQVVAMCALVASSVVGILRWSHGDAETFPTFLSLGWVGLDLLLLSSVVRAAHYRPTPTDPIDQCVDGSVLTKSPASQRST